MQTELPEEELSEEYPSEAADAFEVFDTNTQTELPEEEYPSDAADAFETADLNIADANLDGLVN